MLLEMYSFICYVNPGRDRSVAWVRYATAKVADPAMGELHNHRLAKSLGELLRVKRFCSFWFFLKAAT